MIARLRGELLEAEGGRIVVEACGVGYEVFVPDSVLFQLPPLGEPVDLRIRQVFREDHVALYGFLEDSHRQLFDLLQDVKGCGPKVGLALLGQVGDESVVLAIQTQDVKLLTRASGVGMRLAERICLELKDKIQEQIIARKTGAVASKPKPMQVPDDVVDALMALGYRRQEAENAASVARERSDQLEEQIRLALRSLSR